MRLFEIKQAHHPASRLQALQCHEPHGRYSRFWGTGRYSTWIVRWYRSGTRYVAIPEDPHQSSRARRLS